MASKGPFAVLRGLMDAEVLPEARVRKSVYIRPENQQGLADQ